MNALQKIGFERVNWFSNKNKINNNTEISMKMTQFWKVLNCTENFYIVQV